MVGKTAEQAGIIHHGALVFSTIAQSFRSPLLHCCAQSVYCRALLRWEDRDSIPNGFVAFPDASLTIYGPKAIRLLAKENRFSEEETGTDGRPDKRELQCVRYVDSGQLDAVIGKEMLRTEVVQFLNAIMKNRLTGLRPAGTLSLNIRHWF